VGGGDYADGCPTATPTDHLRDTWRHEKEGRGGKEKDWIDCVDRDVLSATQDTGRRCHCKRMNATIPQ